MLATAIVRWIAEKQDLEKRGPIITIFVPDGSGTGGTIAREIENFNRKNSVESEKQIAGLLKELGLTPRGRDSVEKGFNRGAGSRRAHKSIRTFSLGAFVIQEYEIPQSSFEHPDNFYLMEALEIVPKSADQLEHFTAWGFLIADSEIVRRTWAGVQKATSERTVPSVVLEMSLEERRALRDRVKAKYQRHGGFPTL